MKTDYFNFNQSPWTRANVLFELDHGEYKFLLDSNGDKFIIARAGEGRQRIRRSEGKYYMRKLSSGNEELIVYDLLKRGYRPQKRKKTV